MIRSAQTLGAVAVFVFGLLYFTAGGGGRTSHAGTQLNTPTGTFSECETSIITANPETGVITADGFIPLHFRVTHQASVSGPYQFVVTVRDDSGTVVGTREFPDYRMVAKEQRTDEFVHGFELPPGRYHGKIELWSLYPEVHRDGTRISDHHVCYSTDWDAVVN